MIKIQGIRKYLSMMLFELPAYVLKLHRSDSGWLYITNRKEKYIPAVKGSGLSLLGDFTSKLGVATHFPVLSNQLFKKATTDYPFCFSRKFESVTEPEVSFIIGHRGKDKIENLNLVLESIAGQTNKSLECIVVEQSATADLKDELPAWVRYYHQQTGESDLYNRSAAFNFGIEQAKADNLILHDNDLCIPACYTDEHLKLLSCGYDLVNLKRYIFGLNKLESSQLLLNKNGVESFSPDYILQNAKGGGSLAITRFAYEKIGGYDNRFQGWGGEDNELWQRAQILDIYPFSNLPLIHLWHKPQPDRRGGRHGGGANTEQLIDELSVVSIYERIKNLQKGQPC